MADVHNHGPDEGPGLMCPEVTTEGGLKGLCLWPADRIETIDVEPKPPAEDFIVDVTRKGNKCGTARISPNGEIVNIELDTGLLPSILSSALNMGVITSLSLAPHYNMNRPGE